jgi:hypothetical protein
MPLALFSFTIYTPAGKFKCTWVTPAKKVGSGPGIAPDNQTLPATRLQILEKEKRQLIAFLHSLTDTVRVNLKIKRYAILNDCC